VYLAQPSRYLISPMGSAEATTTNTSISDI
jgi:hypothetical protein